MINTDFTIGTLWYSGDETRWKDALSLYWTRVQPANLSLEQRMDTLDIREVEAQDEHGWFEFLHDEYFVWKYTAKNRLATTRMCLEEYVQENGLTNLSRIKEQLLVLDHRDIDGSLETARSIPGLGYSGASGLLSLLYPKWYGTVDQFVVKAFREIPDLPEEEKLKRVNGNNITLRGGILLAEIMRRKAQENNQRFNTNFWTPRKIDQVLWAFR
ncbi:hypothetical protein [Flavisolibacter nicotianae]|uniref:hypothetical protein n=1 Tax=Flavisolibacter nicotianae TaxID=2364882 RepID=UPI000EB56578|nr:hypothetical protein [Flavisolibacter nicotianae]